jgi:hypothetical protein
VARHKFKVGEIVDYSQPRLTLSTVRARYEIVCLLPSTAASFSTGSRLPVSCLNGSRKKANSREDHRKANPEFGGGRLGCCRSGRSRSQEGRF